MPQVVAEYLDRIATVEMRPGGGNLPRGVIHRLYEAARGDNPEPLHHRMATGLRAAIKPGDTVFILTGAGGPPVLPCAEVDGIPGAVAIGRAIQVTLGAEVVILTEDRAREPVRAATWAASMNWRLVDGIDPGNALVWEPTPLDRGECEAHAAKLFDRFNPTAVIGIEKLSPNRSGVIHGATGLDYDDMHTKSDVYVSEATTRGIFTCGIGDGGNEVGFGKIVEDVAAIMPAGTTCLCPCGGGSASSVATDELLVAAISDWGGYSLTAMLAFLAGNPRVLVRPDEVERMILATVNAGAFDGAAGRPSLSDDGVSVVSQKAYVAILHELVTIALSDLASPGH